MGTRQANALVLQTKGKNISYNKTAIVAKMANNMSTLACEALTARLDDLRLSAPYTAGKLGMRCNNLTLDGKHLSLKLADDMDSLTIPRVQRQIRR